MLNNYQDGRKPYFYIIKHKDSKKMYAGVKWGKSANPDCFMQDIKSGYITSSNKIHEILEQEIGVIFSIEQIIEESEVQVPFGCLHIADYERWFLNFYSCGLDDMWYNGSFNYDGSYGTDTFKRAMVEKYGFESASSSEIIKEKIRITNLKRYGGFTLETTVGSERVKSTMNKLYGVDYPSQSEEIRKKIENSFKIKYGENASNPSHVKEIRLEAEKTMLSKYGVRNAFKSEVFLEKSKNIMIERYGVEKALQNSSISKKQKETMVNLYGVEYAIQNKEILEKALSNRKKNTILKYGVDHTGKVEWECKSCGVAGKNLSNFTRFHRKCENSVILSKGINFDN